MQKSADDSHYSSDDQWKYLDIVSKMHNLDSVMFIMVTILLKSFSLFCSQKLKIPTVCSF